MVNIDIYREQTIHRILKHFISHLKKAQAPTIYKGIRYMEFLKVIVIVSIGDITCR